MLVEENRTLTDDDSFGFDDDEYYGYVITVGPPIWILTLGASVAVIAGALVGFLVAMRRNPGFNKRVCSTGFLQPLVKSQNSLVRSTLNLPQLTNYDEIQHLVVADDRDAPQF